MLEERRFFFRFHIHFTICLKHDFTHPYDDTILDHVGHIEVYIYMYFLMGTVCVCTHMGKYVWASLLSTIKYYNFNNGLCCGEGLSQIQGMHF